MTHRRYPEAALASAAFFLTLATALQAAPTVGSSADYLARMDTDRDGRVSLPEFQAWMGYAFERMDVDRDGVVETHELPGGRGREVSLQAHRERQATTFARQDRDRSGFLDARELAAPPR